MFAFTQLPPPTTITPTTTPTTTITTTERSGNGKVKKVHYDVNAKLNLGMSIDVAKTEGKEDKANGTGIDTQVGSDEGDVFTRIFKRLFGI